MSVEKRSILAAVALVAGLVARPASALPIQFDLQSGVKYGFAYSLIHSASVSSGAFWPSGTTLFTVTGSLLANESGGVFNFQPATLTSVGVGGGYSGTWDLKILSGVLDTTVAANALLGSLSYELWNGASLHDSGAFYFFNRTFAGPANGVSTSGLYLWGNNWDNSQLTKQQFIDSGGKPLGMDLGATGGPFEEQRQVSEPASLTMVGIGMVGLWYARRRGRRLDHQDAEY